MFIMPIVEKSARSESEQMKQKKKNSGKQFTNISIPTSLFERIEEQIEGTDFTSVSDYVAYVLNEVLTENEEETESVSKEDEERIKERLKALGYLE